VIPAKKEPIRSRVPLRRFRYDARHDILKCPKGRVLRPTRRVEHGRFFYSKAKDCRSFPMRGDCLSPGRVNKAVVVSDEHPALVRARRRKESGLTRTPASTSATAGVRRGSTARRGVGTGSPGRSGAGFKTCACKRF